MEQKDPGLLRQLYWDLKHRNTRFQFWQALLMEVPGRFGQKLRWKIYRKFFGKVGKYAVIHMDVRFRNIGSLVLGDNVHIGEKNVIQAAGGVELGDNTILGPGVMIWSANHKFEAVDIPIIKQGFDYKKVVIGNNVWIGANAFIMPGAVIGDGCIISAGSVVGGKTVAPYKILAGNPARVIGTRENKIPENSQQQES